MEFLNIVLSDRDAAATKMDLWADHQDNDQSQQTPLGATDGLKRTVRKSRRPTERDVLAQLRAWLLEDYVAPYCRALASTRIFRHCYWVDALDGVARAQLTAAPIAQGDSIATGSAQGTTPTVANGQGDSIVTGSAQGTTPTVAKGRGRKKGASQALHEYPPILQPTVKLSQALALESRPITLHSLFLASGSSNARGRSESHRAKEAQNGKEPVGESTLLLPKESGVISQSWLEVAARILPAIEQSPAIFLLNPLAPVLFTEGDLRPFYHRATPTEICLFLSHKQIMAHFQSVTRTTENKSSPPANTLTTLLRTDRWKTLVPEHHATSHIHAEKQEQVITGFIELFSDSLKRHFAFPIQTISIPSLVAPATVEDMPYTILFATKRQDSLFCMNNAIYYYRRRLEEESYNSVLGEEWFRAQLQSRYDEARKQLAQRILQQGRVQRVRRWPDLRLQLLLTQFGQFLLQDYDITMQQLLLSREVSCTWRSMSTTEKLDRIPGNEDTLTWHSPTK